MVFSLFCGQESELMIVLSKSMSTFFIDDDENDLRMSCVGKSRSHETERRFMFLNTEFTVPKSKPSTEDLVKFFGENVISSKDELIDILDKYNECEEKHSAFFDIFFSVLSLEFGRDSVSMPVLSYKDILRDTTEGFYFGYFLEKMKKFSDRNDSNFSKILADISFYAVIGGMSADAVVSSFVTWGMADSCCFKAALLSEKGPDRAAEEFFALIDSMNPLDLIAKSEKNESDGEEFYCFRNPSSDYIMFVFSVSDEMKEISGKMLVRGGGFEDDLCRTPLLGIVPKYIENILKTKDPVVYSSSMRCLVEVQKTDICFDFLIDRLLKDHYRFYEDRSADSDEICRECHRGNSFSSDLILGLISEKYPNKANDVFLIANEAIRNGAPDSLIFAMDLMCNHAESVDFDVLKEFISLGSRRIENLLKEDHFDHHLYNVISTLNDIEGFGSHEKELALLLSNDSRSKIAIAGCDWYCNMICEDHHDIDLQTAQKLIVKSLYLITDGLREGSFSESDEHCFMELCRHIINSKRTGIDEGRMAPFVHETSRYFVENIADDFSSIDFYGTSIPGLFVAAMSIYKECLNLEDLKAVALAFEKRDTNDYELFHDILTFLANDHRKILSGAEGQELISRFRSSVKSIHGLDAVTRVKMLATITMMNQQSCGIDRGKQ